jgi:adenylate cyclase
MQDMPDLKAHKGRFWIYLVGALLTGALGWFLTLPLGDGLARLSYDIPFTLKTGGTEGVVMVFITTQSKRNLGEAENLELDRRFHAALVERLHADGARLVFFDLICFDRQHPDPAVDKRFINAVRTQGKVVLVTEQTKEVQMNAITWATVPIALSLADAVAGWGQARIDPDADKGIRHMYMGTEDEPSAGWVAAKLLDAPVTRNETNRLRERWLNYYGPPGNFSGVNFDQALETNGLPPGFFNRKIVVVCAGAGVAGPAQDEFANPYSRFGARLSYGGEVQAQTLLNLLSGDWLERLQPRWEFWLVVAWGFLCAFGLSGRRPWNAALVTIAAVVLIAGFSIHLQFKHHLWWNWMIPVVQTPVAFVWSVGCQYATEFRRRRTLRKAFSAYLSPYMADRIANSEFDLALGGKEIEATVMFTDLEGFTKMSENLPPAEVSRILTSYFNLTTRAILDQEGTIIKYIGDAVMAVWGAPLPEAKHARHAVLAAWGMHQAGQQEIEGRRLRTRIGINTGRVLAGNLGSTFRFDYTLIGDTTNFASRLEGINKYLGTDILISGSTHQQLGDEIKLRALGQFLVVGKAKPMEIFEVLGPVSNLPQDPPWLTTFDKALDQFKKREFEQAERLLCQVKELRGGKDGPSDFYLKQISQSAARWRADESWNGTVVLESK